MLKMHFLSSLPSLTRQAKITILHRLTQIVWSQWWDSRIHLKGRA